MIQIEQLNAPDLAARLKDGPAPVLVDVREPWEVAIASLPGAVCIPLGELVRRHTELDPDAEHVMVCHHGYRSLQAAMFLMNQGFERVANLRGGIEAWSTHVDPGVPRY
jgi:rhodanese-related sulfurtransferase